MGHFPKLSLKPELQLQLWAELVLSLSYPATQAPVPQPDEFNLPPIEQYPQSKICLSLSIGPNKTV